MPSTTSPICSSYRPRRARWWAIGSERAPWRPEGALGVTDNRFLPIGAMMHASGWTPFVVCPGLLGAVLTGCRSREDAFRATRAPVGPLDSILAGAADVGLPLRDAPAVLRGVPDSRSSSQR